MPRLLRPFPPAPPPSITPPVAAALAERRHLSVLSCVLCDADSLAAQLDPDDHYELMQHFLSNCEAVVSPYEGRIMQQSNDGVLMYFGYPQSHEDEALRAVRPGLALASNLGGELAVLATPSQPLAVRVGIASGVMIITPEVSSALGVGSVSTQALRLGALAEPNMVVISEATAQLVSGYVECKELESTTHADSAQSAVAYIVLSESTLQTPFEVRAARGLTPFVGREAEVALLQDRWADVQEGMGQVVWIQGEAGLGKSRLVEVLKEEVAGEPVLVLESRCSLYHQHTAFYPIMDGFQRALSAQSAFSPGTPLERLEALLSRYDQRLNETVPLLAGLLSLPVPEGRYAPLNLTPQQQRARTLAVLWSLLQVQASRSPLLFVLEDVHWIDPSTLDFLQLVLRQVALESMLVVLTSRPEFEAPWGQRSEITPVVLHRLNRTRSEMMIAEVAGGKSLPAAVLAQVVEKTDGVPLFIEEMTKAVLESGALQEVNGQYETRGSFAALTIPATLHDSLMARLDRLPSAKGLAQQASVMGRQFSYALLHAVTQLDEATLQRELERLVEAELVHQRGLPPEATYVFKHALIQDACPPQKLNSH